MRTLQTFPRFGLVLLLVVTGVWADDQDKKLLARGQPILTIKGDYPPEFGLISLAISPDGKRIAGSTEQFWENDGIMSVWDAATGREVPLSFKDHGTVYSLAFSPDSKRIVTGGGKGRKRVTVWDAATGQELLTLKGHKEQVLSVTFSADGKRIISGSGNHRGEADEGEVKVWDAATGKELLGLRQGTVKCLAISPDGKRIVSGGFVSIWGTLTLWDTDTGKQIFALNKGHTGAVTGVALSPDGQQLVSTSHDGTLKIWDAATGKELRTITPSCDQIHKVFDLDQGKLVTVPQKKCQMYTVVFSPDGQQIACGGWDRSVKVFDAKSGQEARTFRGHEGSVRGVAFSADGKRL